MQTMFSSSFHLCNYCLGDSLLVFRRYCCRCLFVLERTAPCATVTCFVVALTGRDILHHNLCCRRCLLAFERAAPSETVIRFLFPLPGRDGHDHGTSCDVLVPHVTRRDFAVDLLSCLTTAGDVPAAIVLIISSNTHRTNTERA